MTHIEEKVLEYCANCFSIAGHLEEPRGTHSGEILFKCTKCDNSFSTSSYLKTHERIHSGEILFKGTMCKKSFSPSSYLETHETTLERSHSRTHSVFFKIKFLDGVWKDPHKREAFYMLKVLQELLNSWPLKGTRGATGEKPFKCTKCDKRFSTSSYLKNFERIHSGGKPFKCTKCDRCFSRSSSLMEQESTQTGVRLFKCSKCDKSFLKSDQF